MSARGVMQPPEAPVTFSRRGPLGFKIFFSPVGPRTRGIPVTRRSIHPIVTLQASIERLLYRSLLQGRMQTPETLPVLC